MGTTKSEEEEERWRRGGEEEPAVLASQYMQSFTSPSQVSMQDEHTLPDTGLPGSDTSLDELQSGYHTPAKRSSKSRHPQRKKRRLDRQSTQYMGNRRDNSY